VRHTEENAAEAAQESEVLNAAVEAAATAYGAPAGAAAYGAWLAYHDTRNVELALRAGALAALSSESGSIVQEMPTGTVSDVVKKAAVSGALGGIAVAASGGDADAVRDGFVKAGGMVIVQSGESYVKKEYTDPITANADSYCMSAVGASCQYALPKLKHDATNAILQDKDGNPVVDTDYINEAKKDVVDWQQTAIGLDKIGDTPAVISNNKDWAISFSKSNCVDRSANLPSVVVTYIGDGSILQGQRAQLEKVLPPDGATVTPGTVPTQPPSGQPSSTADQRWAPFNNIDTKESFFTHTNPKLSNDSIQVGDTLLSKADVGLYIRPARWASPPEKLPKSSIVIVTSVQTLFDNEGRSQKWIELENPVRSGDSASRGALQAESRAAPVSPGKESKAIEKIWCIDQQLEAAFEINSSHEIRPLLSSIRGTVTREKSGVFHLVLSKDTNNLLSALLSDPTTYDSIVTAKGSLFRRVGPKSLVPVGTCTTVSSLAP
jgi:hypothetical protein